MVRRTARMPMAMLLENAKGKAVVPGRAAHDAAGGAQKRRRLVGVLDAVSAANGARRASRPCGRGESKRERLRA